MNRNIRIICISAIAVLVLGIAVAVYFLYRDVPGYEWMMSGKAQEQKTALLYPAKEKGEVVTPEKQVVPEPEVVPALEAKQGQKAKSAPEVVPAPEVKPEPEKQSEVKPEPEKQPEVKPEPVEIKIPKGPFKVRNVATGKTCYIGQSSDNSIYMEQDGKTLWTIPFAHKLCGNVEAVDYYENGKLQYLFIAGGKMHLLDRLGNSVRTFPKQLPGEPLLGPDVYDFNKTRKYNIMVLNKDNTIQMYNMKGQHPSAWEGIRCDEQILGLPQLQKISGKSYWIVKTPQSTIVYPFYGGKAIKKFKGDVKLSSTSVL